MGLLEFLAGKKKIVDYEIVFDEQRRFAVKITGRAGSDWEDLLRLWAQYHCKLVYNMEGPASLNGRMLVEMLDSLIELGPSFDADLFEAVGSSATKVQSLQSHARRYHGEFFAGGKKERP